MQFSARRNLFVVLIIAITVSVDILANNASAHGGLLANCLSYVFKFFGNDSIELLEIMLTVEHSIL